MSLDLDVTIQFASATRYNIGVFVAGDGKSPQLLPANGGASSCTVSVLPNTTPFLNLDGGSCGDGSGSINSNTGKGTFRMSSVAVPCTTDGSGNTILTIPYLVSWDQSSNFNACVDNTYPAPGTTSKCNTGTVSFPPGATITVLPAISITDGVTSIASGSNNTYVVVITNTTNSPLSNAIFKLPAVSNFTVSSITCAASSGATCPGSYTTSAMQGSGITLPTMPNGSVLTFNVSGTIGNVASSTTLTNTASVSVGSATNPASDIDTVLPSVDHYELSLPTTSVSCLPSTVIVTACADSSSPCTNPSASISGSTATLATSAGTLGTTVVSFNSGGTATTTLAYPSASDGSAATVTLSGESTAAINSRKCCPNGTSCSVVNSCSTTFNTAGFVFANAANGAPSSIATQVAGATSGTYYLRAVKSSSTSTQACASALSGTTTVNFGYECNNPTTCSAGYLMTINGQALNNSSNANSSHGNINQPISLTFDSNGNAPFTLAYSDVGLVTLWAAKASGGSLLSSLIGSSNSFVVKPDHFDITNVKRTSDNFPNPGATSATWSASNGFIKAGANFTATVKAMTSGGVVTPNYGKETTPQGVRLFPTLVLPTGGNYPALTNNLIAGNEFGATGQVNDPNGTATVNNLSWNEVGIITLGVLPPNVLSATDLGAVPNNNGTDFDYLGGGNVPNPVTFNGNYTNNRNIGRFYPDHFSISSGSIANRAELSCSITPTFTYFGEQLNALLTLTARTSGGLITKNYTAGFNYLDPTVFANLQLDAVDRTTVLTPGPPYLLGSNPNSKISNVGMPAITCSPCFSGAGVAGVTVPFFFTRGTTAGGAYANVDIGINPADLDGVTVPYDIDTATPTNPGSTPNKGRIASTVLRYGRLSIANSYGAEMYQLPVTVSAQYWNGSAYVVNTLDSCTPLLSSNFSKSNVNGATFSTSIANGKSMQSGVGSIVLTAPTGFTGKASTDINSLIPYLPGTGRETFGVYKAGPVIYLREVY